ncbi:hypothetical protein HYY73_04905 [Candidatus Woesearchaeota archaeon]|nr:hypothetical protein [Candidatus Woesearchaeota archaeon]
MKSRYSSVESAEICHLRGSGATPDSGSQTAVAQLKPLSFVTSAKKAVCWLVFNVCGEKSEEAFNKKWEISLAELENSIGKLFKVTRRLPEMSIAETKLFRAKKEAVRQFNEWLE